MLYKAQLVTSWVRRGTALLVLGLGLISAPLRAMEEVTVNGAQAAAEVRAQDARFRSDMELFVETVELRFKADLEFDLKRAVAPPLRLASSLANSRG